MNFQLKKFSKDSMDVSISHLHDSQQSGNICIFCKYYYFTLRKHCTTSGGRSDLKLTRFPINNQDPSKILKIYTCIYENYNSTDRRFK